jgi:peptide/nickel transport system ATP-binding protein
VPRATDFPAGCRFAERCHKTLDLCRQTDPDLISLSNNHRVACIGYDTRIVDQPLTPLEVREGASSRPKAARQIDAIPLIRARDLQVWFPIRRGLFKRTVGYVYAVDGVNLTVSKGKTLALVGESGCGKTTLGQALIQLRHPTGGTVNYADIDLTALSRAQLKPYRKRLQIVFQDPFSSLNPRQMVGEILQEGMEAHGIGRTRTERLERAQDLMEQVGLDPRMVHRYPHEFSGGQRQRIGIARCLAVDPEFIICDEPTSALDVSVQAQIINLLGKLQANLGLTYLLITHDLSVVEYLADEVAVMYLGRIVERGSRDEIFNHPKHPYTRALLSAVPKIDPRTGIEKIQLAGDVPSPIHPPEGCHFHPRCPDRLEECVREYPAEYVFSETHACQCTLYRTQS